MPTRATRLASGRSNESAYRNFPNEIQLLWYKDLIASEAPSG